MWPQAVIFDLDGVLTDTAACHYEAWKQMAQRENLYFDRSMNQQLKGVSRMHSLEIILREMEGKELILRIRWPFWPAGRMKRIKDF